MRYLAVACQKCGRPVGLRTVLGFNQRPVVHCDDCVRLLLDDDAAVKRVGLSLPLNDGRLLNDDASSEERRSSTENHRDENKAQSVTHTVPPQYTIRAYGDES